MRKEANLIIAANFCEGRDPQKIDTIAKKVEEYPGIMLLDVEPHEKFNRTNIIFFGLSEAVSKAALMLADAAYHEINMEKHRGEHTRIGALDIVPFIPIHSDDIDLAVEISRNFGKEIAARYDLPVYLFGFSALKKPRQKLTHLRRIHYDNFIDSLKKPIWKPDYGPVKFNSQKGGCLVGSRLYYISFLIYFDTDDFELLEEMTRAYTSPVNLPRHTMPSRLPKIDIGLDPRPIKKLLTFVDYLPTERMVRIICTVKNYQELPLHFIYETLVKLTGNYGIPVIGSQILDYVPAEALVKTGKFYFQGKQKELDDLKYMTLAINRLRLNAIESFNLEHHILDFLSAKANSL